MNFLRLLLFFDLQLLYYYYFNLKSSIIPWDIYLSLDISLSCSFVIVSELFCWKFFETSVILSAILLSIKSPAASGVILIALLNATLNASVPDCLAWSKGFWLYLPLMFLPIFVPLKWCLKLLKWCLFCLLSLAF